MRGWAWAGAQKAPQDKPSILDRLNAMISPGKSAWRGQQIAEMARIRDAAVQDPYALNELRHLTDNIGPRLSGSAQAQAAVDYVAAEMRALGATVTLEKAMVPHWVRGAETGELVAWPGQAAGTKQKIVLTALGPSVATPADGVTAEVAVVDNWQQLRALPPDAVKGKILLFNHAFDKELAAQGGGIYAYGGGVVYRGMGPIAGVGGGRGGGAGALGGGSRLPAAAYGPDRICAGCREDPGSGGSGRGRRPAREPRSPGAGDDASDADSPDAARRGRYNVIADWKGSEHPEQMVVVSGHLDSWDLGTGALDDGAGVAVSMQTIHLLQRSGNSSPADGADDRVDERRGGVGGRGRLHGGPQG